ncbi:hypothetical protein [Rhodanobacter sp. OR87]|uniref:hypothetical protein n=1 Tax=Rhodanobacter sp. OR87 TaxID=1076523 RepID=UPI0005C1B8F9|nr:hypothetical protein [Rhodanobacter sp. OR87]
MSLPDDQLRALREVNPEARVLSEGGLTYVFLPKQPIQVGEQGRAMDALLCPNKYGGYDTRLFLEHPITERGANWSAHVILGRTWHTFSWNGVSSAQPLMQILLAHLAVLR